MVILLVAGNDRTAYCKPAHEHIYTGFERITSWAGFILRIRYGISAGKWTILGRALQETDFLIHTIVEF